MAKSTKNLRELYGFLLGEDLVSKLSDEQISLVSLYYGSLSAKEKSKIDDAITKGKSHDLLEMAQTLLEESQQDKKPNPPKAKKTKVKVSNNSRKTSKQKSNQANKNKKTTFDSIEVDERILRILGLEDVFDMDLDTYLTELKSKMAEARMPKTKIPSEESELLNNEFKKVKRLDKEKRYTIKRKKISTQNFIPRKSLKVSKERYLLVGKVDVKEEEAKIKKEKKDPLLQNVITIRESVTNILSLLGVQNKLITGQSDKERRRKEREKREQREKNLEKIKKAAFGAIKSVLAPVQDILDRIIKFLTFVILGRAVIKFLDWAGDPKNKSKLEALGNLLKTWWPALLGAFILFTTPLGKFIRVVVGTITKFTFQLLRRGIPALRRFLKERDRKKNRITSDSQRRKRRIGKNSRVTEGIGDRFSRSKSPRFKSARGGLFGMLALSGLEMATPFLSGKIGEVYGNLGIGDAALSNEDLLKEYQREQYNIQRKTSGPFGGLFSQTTDYSRLDALEQELERRGLAYKDGGEVFSGVVDKNDGVKFAGAGPDTQAFPVVGGGTAVLKPGELVLNEQQQKNLQRDTGVDPKSYVFNVKPRQVSGRMFGFNSGGIIGGKRRGYQGGGLFNGLDSFGRNVFENVGGSIGRNRGKQTGIPGGGWVGEQVGKNRGVNLYEKLTSPIRQQGGGIVGGFLNWWNKGRNVRVPQESTASWRELMADDRRQLTRTNKAFKSGATGVKGWRPLKAFTPEMVRTGPTPAVRQAFERGIPASTSFQLGYNAYAPFSRWATKKREQKYGSGTTYDMMVNPTRYQGGGKVTLNLIKNFELNKTSNMRSESLPRKAGGGLSVKENTGMNISGATADRQLTLLQPGEYVLPVDFVNRVGVPTLDKLVSYFDSNSNAAKLGSKNVNRVIPGPRKRGSSKTQMLPAITQPGSNGMIPARTPGSEVPSFNMICAGSLTTRSEQMSIYGIVG